MSKTLSKTPPVMPQDKFESLVRAARAINKDHWFPIIDCYAYPKGKSHRDLVHEAWVQIHPGETPLPPELGEATPAYIDIPFWPKYYAKLPDRRWGSSLLGTLAGLRNFKLEYADLPIDLPSNPSCPNEIVLLIYELNQCFFARVRTKCSHAYLTHGQLAHIAAMFIFERLKTICPTPEQLIKLASLHFLRGITYHHQQSMNGPPVFRIVTEVALY